MQRNRFRILTAGALLTAVLAGAPTPPPPTPVPGELFRFADPKINESSGVVDGGKVLYTINDSGGAAKVYVVDKTSGKTVSTIDVPWRTRDTEALAPAGDGGLWVGDIGDNRAVRENVVLGTVPVAGKGRRANYRCRYEDGPKDAETLLVDPADDGVYVVSKSLLGAGRVYRMPPGIRPGDDCVLTALPGSLPSMLTDGAFLPGGRYALIRSYARAHLIEFPSLTEVTSFQLPSQQQGEGLAITADGKILLTSEGVNAPVLQIDMPQEIRDAVARAPAAPPAAKEPSQAQPNSPGRRPWALAGVVGGLLVVAVAAALGFGGRRR